MTDRPPRPRVALVFLALMLFLYFTAEVFTVGALRPMASSFGVGVSAVGSLVTVYAGVAAVVIVPMSLVATRVKPRWLLTGSMAVLGVSLTGVALAPSLSWALAARCLAALCHGAVWASAPAVASALLPGRPARATAYVFVGSALGSVLGAPLVAAISVRASWRAAALLLAGMSVLCAIMLAQSIPRSLRSEHQSERERRDGAENRPPARDVPAVARWCVLVILIAAAHLASFTFLAERAAAAGVTATGLPVLLLAMGTSGLLGTLAMARVNDAHPRASTLASCAVMALSLGACALAIGPVVLGAAAALWSAAYSGLTVAMQAFVLRDAPTWAQRASAWYVLCFQIGIASGSGLGALVIARTGSTELLALVSAGMCAAALALGSLLLRRS